MGQKQVRKQAKAQESVGEVEQTAPEKDAKIEEDVRYADELLDEIDEILEENAEAFVANYIQGGGQ